MCSLNMFQAISTMDFVAILIIAGTKLILTLDLTLPLAFLCRSNATTLEWPFSAAMCRGVFPSCKMFKNTCYNNISQNALLMEHSRYYVTYTSPIISRDCTPVIATPKIYIRLLRCLGFEDFTWCVTYYISYLKQNMLQLS